MIEDLEMPRLHAKRIRKSLLGNQIALQTEIIAEHVPIIYMIGLTIWCYLVLCTMIHFFPNTNSDGLAILYLLVGAPSSLYFCGFLMFVIYIFLACCMLNTRRKYLKYYKFYLLLS